MKSISSLPLWAILLATASGAETGVTIGDLRCEYAANPLGLESTTPRFSWVLRSTGRGQKQSAYQIQVASSEEKLKAGTPDLWETGKVVSEESTQIPYRGSRPTSRQRCYWRVRAWDKNGQATPYAEIAWWEMGLLSQKDWQAAWIGYPPGWPGRALYFRNVIAIEKQVRQARVYVAGLGYYELRLNGESVGNHVLDPGWTDYSKRVLYATYDVGSLLRRGNNAVAVIVGNGWYGMPKLLLQMEVRFTDGTVETLATRGGHASPAWRVTSGPILANSIYDGETYDARLEKAGWDLPDYESASTTDRTDGWSVVVPVEPPGGHLVSQTVEPIKVVSTVQPKAVSEPKPGIAVYDTGQNLAGWAELNTSGPRGTRVTLRFAENLAADGTVNQDNLRKAAATDVYIVKGEGREVWEPRFTYHGFRYVQVEGLPSRPSPDNITVKVVRSSVEPNGTIETSDDLVNRIQKMVWWTESSNLYGVPTDCPQRDERQGWMNDLTVRLEEAIYNFRLPLFLPKFLDDVADTQTADGAIADTVPFRWGFQPADPVSASYLLLGWLPYQHYGDKRAIAAHFTGFKAWTDYLQSRSRNGIVTYGNYGDWSPPKEFSIAGSHHGTGAVSKDTPPVLMSTGYLYFCAQLVSRMAEVLGRPADTQKYGLLATRVADAFNREYWDEKAGGYGSNNQSANSFALFLGIVPKDRIPRVVENLVKDVGAQGGHLTTGNLCTKYLLEALSDNGHDDEAFEIVKQTTYPSWGFMLANGATTLWERWEHMTGGQMNSHNHPMMGSVSAWFYKYLAGINVDPRGPGFKRIILRPHPVKDLNWVRAEYTSLYGVIRSSWRKENGAFLYNITVPVNTTATVYIPATHLDRVRESGRAISGSESVKWLRQDDGHVVLETGSGEYSFSAMQQ
jgi:alpha-L-rhamnosidase